MSELQLYNCHIPVCQTNERKHNLPLYSLCHKTSYPQDLTKSQTKDFQIQDFFNWLPSGISVALLSSHQPNLTHWGRVTRICVSKLTIIDSDNGLSPEQHQTIIGTNVGILLIWPLGINFSEILIRVHTSSFMKMSSAKILSRPQCVKGIHVQRFRYFFLRLHDSARSHDDIFSF